MKFEDLGLSQHILDAIKDCGYDTPTPIQEKAIPHILMARDVVGLAQTGTGKTAGFTLPMIEILAGGRAKARMPRSLILSPTRELAAQIADNFDTYGKNCKLTKALLIGGSSMEEQIKIMERGADVLIATPGRLLDLFERGKILLNDIKILVIDEICSLLPPMRQTLLFSATMAPEIKKLTAKFLSNPREVAVDAPASTAITVEQFQVNVSPKNKNSVLEKILKQEHVQNAFIFCNRKRDVDAVGTWLKGKGYKARAMHGDMAQSARTQTLDQFKSGEVTLLVCSDVAARGIDVSSVSHVINYDVPFNPDDYVHRIGRTGRAGEKGRAWMLVTKNDDKFLDSVIKRIGKPVEVIEIDGSNSSSGDDNGSKARSSKPAPKAKDLPEKKTARTADNEQKSKAPNKKPTRSPKPELLDEDPNAAGFGDEVPAFFKM